MNKMKLKKARLRGLVPKAPVSAPKLPEEPCVAEVEEEPVVAAEEPVEAPKPKRKRRTKKVVKTDEE